MTHVVIFIFFTFVARVSSQTRDGPKSILCVKSLVKDQISEIDPQTKPVFTKYLDLCHRFHTFFKGDVVS